MEEPALLQRITHPDDRERLALHREDSLDSNKVSDPVDFRIITRAGEERWITHRCQKVYGRDGTFLGARGSNRDITQRKHTEQVLAKIEERYRTLVENAIEAIFVAVEGKIVFLNQRTCVIAGYSSEELMTRPFVEFIHPDERDTVIDRHIKRLRGEEVIPRYEFRIIRKDGEIAWVELSAVAIDWEGKRATLNFLEDITERKAREHEYQTIIHTAKDGFWQADMQGRFLDVNESYCRLIGYSRDELLNMAIMDIEAIEKSEETARRIQKIQEVGSDTFETRHRCKDGKIVDVEISVNYLQIGHGRMVVFIRDISERKQAEETIRESQTFLTHVGSMAKVGGWKLDVATGKVYWTTETYHIHDILEDKDYDLSGAVTFFDLPGRTILEAAIRRCIETGESYDLELAFTSAKGRHLWTHTIGHAVQKEGKTIEIIGTFQDITERKQSEEVLRESEERFRVAQEMSPDGFTILHPLRNEKGEVVDFTWVYENQAIARINATDPEEVKGKRLLDLFPTHKGTSLFEAYTKVATSGKPQIIEEIYVGEIVSRPIWLRLVVVSMGEDIAILAHDISERKLAEEQLLRSHEQLEKALNSAVETIVKIVELRDPYTAGHQQKVADLAVAIAREMEFNDIQIDQMKTAAMIHDIGKMYVSADILSKPGKLSDMEFSLIKTHAQAGFDIIKGMDFPGAVAETILQHHERLDGSGYPNGLKADDTLMKAKILAVADVVEAMTSHRPYRPTLGINKALEEISRNKGKLYDPNVVDACLELFNSGRFEFKLV